MTLPSLLLLLAPLASEPAPPPATRMLGELVLAQGRLAFAACGGEAAIAEGARAGIEAPELVARLNGGADGSAFIDADVAREPDGGWRIDRVRRAYLRGPRCAEDLGEFIWRAAAADAQWSINVSRRYVTLRRAGRAPLFFRYRSFEAGAEGHWTFEGRADGSALALVMRPQRCVAADGRAVTDWAVTLTVDGVAQEGCAWGGEPR